MQKRNEGWLDSLDQVMCTFVCSLVFCFMPLCLSLWWYIEGVKYSILCTLYYRRYIENPQLDGWMLDVMHPMHSPLTHSSLSPSCIGQIRKDQKELSIASTHVQNNEWGCLHPSFPNWILPRWNKVERNVSCFYLRLLKIHCLENLFAW